MVNQEIESMLDRRLSDFEKLMETRLDSIQDGVAEMRSTMAVFVDKVSNLHKDYVPRSEIEKDQLRMNNEIDGLKKKVERLESWRNTLAGAVAILGFILTVVASSQIWK